MSRPARVLITGNAGAGKTTLAREIGARLGLPVHGLDAIVWRPGWKKTPPAERNLLLQGLADEPAWVIDGVSSVIEARADLIVLLDAPPALCTWRCAVRNTPYLLRSRPGLPADCPELLIIPELLRIIWGFDRHVRPGVLERCAGRLRIVRGAAERDELLSSFR